MSIFFNTNISKEIKPFLFDFIEICKIESCGLLDSKFKKMSSITIPDHFEDPVFMQCNYQTMQLEYKRNEFFNKDFNQQSLIDHELGHCLFQIAHILPFKDQSLGIMEKRPPSFYTKDEISFWTPTWRKNMVNGYGQLLFY